MSAHDPVHVSATRIVATAGGEIAVAEYGDPRGTPLLSLHGMPGCRFQRYWDEDVDASLGFRTIMFDRPGYGRSTRMPSRTVADGARDIAAVADALGLDRFAVIGVSGGGPYALAAAALLGERVTACSAVVAIAPRDADFDWFAGMGEESLVLRRAADEGTEAITALWETRSRAMLELEASAARSRAAPDRRRANAKTLAFAEVRRRALHEQFASGVGGVVDDERATVTPWGFPLEAIRTRVTIWTGDTDDQVPPAHGLWLADHVPGAEIVRLSGGHVEVLAVHTPAILAALKAALGR